MDRIQLLELLIAQDAFGYGAFDCVNLIHIWFLATYWWMLKGQWAIDNNNPAATGGCTTEPRQQILHLMFSNWSA